MMGKGTMLSVLDFGKIIVSHKMKQHKASMVNNVEVCLLILNNCNLFFTHISLVGE